MNENGDDANFVSERPGTVFVFVFVICWFRLKTTSFTFFTLFARKTLRYDLNYAA